MCLYPKLIKNRKYLATKKNRGIIPPVPDPRVLWVPVGCQNCIECRKKKAREWSTRLLEDIQHHTNGRFITLTLNDETYDYFNNLINPDLDGYDRDNAIITLATRNYLERYRKKHGKSLRHWFVTELGHNGTENIHIHGIIWTNDTIDATEYWNWKERNSGRILGGYVWKGYMKNGKLQNYVSERTINYITKYVNKTDVKHRGYQSRILTSAGIGHHYTTGNTNWRRNVYRGNKTREFYLTRTGHKVNLPIYWRNKIYTEEEREKLWLARLDKQERWVMGERIDVSKGQEEYDKCVQWYRKWNTQLGYGSDTIPKERLQYELAKRAIAQETRIQNANKRKNPQKENPKDSTFLKKELNEWEIRLQEILQQ